jgi:predicted RNA methylase
MTKPREIPEEVLAVLRRAVIEARTLRIVEQLDRKLYTSVNKILEAAGGKWDRKAKAHMFGDDPRKILCLDAGTIDTGAASNEAIAHAVANGVHRGLAPTLFPTPSELATRMVDLAQIPLGARVLEPSAGTGCLLAAFPGVVPFGAARQTWCEVVAVEQLQTLATHLKLSGLAQRVICGDFLECDDDDKMGLFDRIIMNPPFDSGADIKHIVHALTFLKPGGRLVALCANGPRQREQFQAEAVHWEDLPEGSFKAAGTGVNVAMFVMLEENCGGVPADALQHIIGDQPEGKPEFKLEAETATVDWKPQRLPF